MPGITLAQAQTQLDAYLAAETAVLAGQKYEIAGRVLQRADLAQIQAGIELWNQRVEALAARASGGRRAIVARPGW
jgi:hypothetical protein